MGSAHEASHGKFDWLHLCASPFGDCSDLLAFRSISVRRQESPSPLVSRTGWLVQQAAREQLIPLEGECCILRHSLFCEGSDCPEKRAATPNREKSAPHHPHLAEQSGAPA